MAEINEESRVNLSNSGGMNESEDPDDISGNSGGDDVVINEEDQQQCKLIPELSIDEIRELEFLSEQDAIEFYQHYAQFKGFGVRKDDVRRDAKGNVISRQLVCNREGERHEKHLKKVSRVKEAKPITRVSCQAKFHVRFEAKSKKWMVSYFEPEHNHDLTLAQQVHLIPTFRELTNGDKAQVDTLKLYGVRSCNIMGLMMGQKGGHDSVGFLKKDLYSHVDKNKRISLGAGDAAGSLNYFTRKGEKDSMFYFRFTRTINDNLENLFWCDGSSRLDYQAFGDVVVFDSTYKKNKYNKPVVIFSSYNHHKETTIFACALVSDETMDTYKWVLQRLDEAMFGKHPKAFVTDGDKAMREAIKVVFPNSTHRLCGWHIQQNAVKKIHLANFLDDFNYLIFGNFSPQRFESKWETMVEKYDLGEDKWIKQMYETKEMWVAPFMRERFFAGIRTTSLCEGINSFIKNYVSCKNSMMDFIYNFERAVEEYRHNELTSDFSSCYGEPVLTTALSGIEQGAAKLLTRNMFREVRHVMEQALSLNLVERSEVCNTIMIKLSVCGRSSSQFLDVYDKNQITFECDCGLSDFKGIPCSHIICAMRIEDFTTFPASLVSNRWLKTAKVDFIHTIPSIEFDSEKLKLLRRGAISAACNFLSEYAADDASDFSAVIEDIYKLVSKVQKRRHPKSTEGNLFVIRDPTVVRTRGARKKLKTKKKKRLCSNCRKSGHTIRTCPTLFEGVGDDEGDSSVEVDDDSITENTVVSLAGGDNGGFTSRHIGKAKRKVGDNDNVGSLEANERDVLSPAASPQIDDAGPLLNFGDGMNMFPQFPPTSQIFHSFPPYSSFPSSSGSQQFLSTIHEVERRAKMAKKD
ncbi:protein FAR1-RELATED SEQUENCE 5-like [Lotus japonicus]|uniref:protein FAR1-RELATED SEQUENCE 5-like n=1 Tax=Lotus japonicus TaxID=34305 RepID=UPI00258C912D|nr:protein FAR1-RELATED SEQUENCE 5-like [Lotus japonicus]